jgi:SAM-dependent methyltransferase
VSLGSRADDLLGLHGAIARGTSEAARAPSHAGLIPTSDLYGYALGDLARCTGCGHVKLDVMPSDEQLASAYAEAEEGLLIAQETGQRATARLALDRIERHRGPGRMIDVGCWVGFLLAEARERGWDVEGTEPSRYASDYAREQLDLPVQTLDLLSADVEPADVVVMGDVIEHPVRPDEVPARPPLVGRPPDPRAVLLARVADRAAAPLRLRAGLDGHRPEGLHHRLLPVAPGGLLAAALPE